MPKFGEKYEHYRGGVYDVVCTASLISEQIDPSTGDMVVVETPIVVYGDNQANHHQRELMAMTLEDWNGKVTPEPVPKFKLVPKRYKK